MILSNLHKLKDTLLGKKVVGRAGLELDQCSKLLAGALEQCAFEIEGIKKQKLEDLDAFWLELKEQGLEDDMLAVEYERDLVIWTLDDAEAEAKRRIELIKSLDSPAKIQEEIDLCSAGAEGTIRFINNWCWTHDPRMPVTTLPFRLFPKQEEYILWLEKQVFRYQQPGLVEKSRDMGVSWLTLAFILKNWRLRDRFDTLVGSKSEDFVDRKGREDTLMEKIRFMIRYLPNWLLPAGFDPDKHMPWMNIFNPETGSFIAGESANENFGRQGRYSFLFIDEFPVFPEGGFAAYTACSQSAKARLFVGTPKGKMNKFAKLRFESRIRVFGFHWKNHPRKDERWYKTEARSMTSAEIGQELDMDYEASQAGLVFGEFEPLYSVITWSEFALFYGIKALDANGRPQIPLDWLVMAVQDVGMSKDHRNVTTWAARPAAGYKLSDSVFLYRQYMSGIGDSTNKIGAVIKEWETPNKEAARMVARKISHDGKSEKVAYEEIGLDFELVEPDYCAGIAQGKNYMEVIDRDKENPFRSYLKVNGRPLMGRSRWYVIVEDKQGMPKWDKSLNRYILPEPENDAGFARARQEVGVYHIPESEIGKPVRLQRPHKAFDDAMDTWRYLAQELPPIASRSKQEELKERLPEGLREINADIDPEKLAMLLITQKMSLAELEAEEKEEMDKANSHWRKGIHLGANRLRW